MGKVYDKIVESKMQKKKSFALLVDPDKTSFAKADQILEHCIAASVDLIFVGGSLMVSNHMEDLVQHFKKECTRMMFNGALIR